MEQISLTNISVSKTNIPSMVEKLNISWVNPRITDSEYPFQESFLGNWIVEVIKIDKSIKFEEIAKLCRQDGFKPASIFHLLSFIDTVMDLSKYKSLIAAGSLCLDDFEHPGCVVLSKEGLELKLGLGNWRGNGVRGYDVLRVKKTD